MAPTWDDLAGTPRWRGVVAFARNWVGPFGPAHGLDTRELDPVLRAGGLSLPPAVREWYLLAGRWDRCGSNVWIGPEALAAAGGMIWVMTDVEGINRWGVRVDAPAVEDPPVHLEGEPAGAVFVTFSDFVGAMVANDVLFADPADPAAELDPATALAGMTRLVSSRVGEYFADAPLEAATAVLFAYPGGAPVFGKGRGAAGRTRLAPHVR
jgi:hypothetical protein